MPFLAPAGFALVFVSVFGLMLASAFKERLHWGVGHTLIFLIPASLLLVVGPRAGALRLPRWRRLALHPRAVGAASADLVKCGLAGRRRPRQNAGTFPA